MSTVLGAWCLPQDQTVHLTSITIGSPEKPQGHRGLPQKGHRDVGDSPRKARRKLGMSPRRSGGSQQWDMVRGGADTWRSSGVWPAAWLDRQPSAYLPSSPGMGLWCGTSFPVMRWKLPWWHHRSCHSSCPGKPQSRRREKATDAESFTPTLLLPSLPQTSAASRREVEVH